MKRLEQGAMGEPVALDANSQTETNPSEVLSKKQNSNNTGKAILLNSELNSFLFPYKL